MKKLMQEMQGTEKSRAKMQERLMKVREVRNKAIDEIESVLFCNGQ